MSSPPRDNVLSSSPTSIHGRGSPVLRRRESAANTSTEWTPDVRPPRLSPTLSRSPYDPDDPQSRERQRTMDVDMAIQLSRARRETISSPVADPIQDVHSPPELPALSPHEEREINIARGHITSGGFHLQDPLDGTSTPPMHHPVASSSVIDLRSHLHQSHDPSLLVSSHVAVDNDLNMGGGLPSYQATNHPSDFDFSPMEAFAAEEKSRLGLAPRFVFKSPSAVTLEETNANTGPSNSPRQRKLSQSTSAPRPRKAAGNKATLLESQLSESIAATRISQILEPSSCSVQSEASINEAARLQRHHTFTGHDRPYRFSFYSNALSATIHSRSLSELPADGQTFEELFQGVGDSSDMPQRKAPTENGRNGGQNKTVRLDPAGLDRKSGGILKNTRDFEDKTWWLDVTSPTDEEMKMLSQVFNIHPLTTEDIQMEETREKIELFRNYYLVCFRSFEQDTYSPNYLEPLNMYIIVFREGILSFHFQPTTHPQNVRRRIKHLKDYISVTSDWISYALIDDITDAFGPLIQRIEYEVDSIDELVLIMKDAEQSDMLRRIGTCRKKVMGLLRLMGNKADVVKGLAKRCNENWRVAPTSDIGLYLSDIQDHLITMTQSLNHYEKILSRSHSNYLAQISIEMTDANNQINDVLSKLTALGTVLIPMNLITGLWGMNVHVPGQDETTSYTWFICIIAGLTGFALIGGYSTYRFMVRN